MMFYSLAVVLGLTTVWILSVVWAYFILLSVPQTDGEYNLRKYAFSLFFFFHSAPADRNCWYIFPPSSAYLNGDIATIPLVDIMRESDPTYSWISYVVSVFIVISVSVSFLTMGTSLKHIRISITMNILKNTLWRNLLPSFLPPFFIFLFYIVFNWIVDGFGDSTIKNLTYRNNESGFSKVILKLNSWCGRLICAQTSFLSYFDCIFNFVLFLSRVLRRDWDIQLFKFYVILPLLFDYLNRCPIESFWIPFDSRASNKSCLEHRYALSWRLTCPKPLLSEFVNRADALFGEIQPADSTDSWRW